MNNIKYLNEDSEVINDSVDNPNDLEKYARQIAKMYKLKYNDDGLRMESHQLNNFH